MKSDIISEKIEDGKHGTLGAYLATQETQRGRALDRKMIEDEFQAIWNVQKEYYKDILTDTLKQNLHQAVFHRKPIYWHFKSLGKCTLEPDSRLMMKSEWLAQEFIMLQDFNNLRLASGNNRPLNDEEREILQPLFRQNAK